MRTLIAAALSLALWSATVHAQSGTQKRIFQETPAGTAQATDQIPIDRPNALAPLGHQTMSVTLPDLMNYMPNLPARSGSMSSGDLIPCTTTATYLCSLSQIEAILAGTTTGKLIDAGTLGQPNGPAQLGSDGSLSVPLGKFAGPSDAAGSAVRLFVTDQTTTSTPSTPTALFFRQENYALGAGTFYLPFVFQLNSSGTGPRQNLTVQTNLDAHNAGDFLVGAQFLNSFNSGSGFSIPVATQCVAGVSLSANAQCEGIEVAVGGSGPLTRNVGVNIIDSWSGTAPPIVNNGIMIDNVVSGGGWQTGIKFGYTNLPVGSGGALIDTISSTVAIRAGIDLSKISSGTDGTVLLPLGGSIKFGGAGAAGGEIVSATGTSGAQVLLASGAIVVNNTSGTQRILEADLTGINGTSVGATTPAPGTFTTANVQNSLIIPFGTPASATAACTQGQIEMDATYTYSCVATNSWHRVSNGAAW